MDTHISGDCTAEAFREASMELDAAYTLFAKACGLSASEYWTLLLVSQGVRTQGEINVRLSISKQTLNSAVMALKRKGLVRLEPLEQNQRVKRLFLTNMGVHFVEAYIVQMRQLEKQAWQSMDPGEQSSLTKLTKKFSALLTAAMKQIQDSDSNEKKDSDLWQVQEIKTSSNM